MGKPGPLVSVEDSPSGDGFKHPTKKGVIIAHSFQIALGLATGAICSVSMYDDYANSGYYSYYTPEAYSNAGAAFCSLSVAIHAALSILLLCSQMKPIWLLLIIYNTLIMTLGVCGVVSLLFSLSWNPLYWYIEMAFSCICVLLSIPSTIRAAKLKRHHKRALKLQADQELDDVRRKSIELEDGPKPAAQSVRSEQSSKQSGQYNEYYGPSRPISTVETTAHWSNGTGSMTLDPASDRGSDTHSLPSYGRPLSKDMDDEIRPVL